MALQSSKSTPATPTRRKLLVAAAIGASVFVAVAYVAAMPARPDGGPGVGRETSDGKVAPPLTLAATGLFDRPEVGALARIAPGVRRFKPRYPLWTDGAAKDRWILLPEGAVIDASDPTAWEFPVGTKLWKEFRFEHRVETRFMELRADGEWLYATYVWDEAGREATLAPEYGVRHAANSAMGTRHDVPSLLDCRACHEAHPSRVLGFSAVQLAGDEDTIAPHGEARHAADHALPGDLALAELLERGLVAGDAEQLAAVAAPPSASSPLESAALGYLHGNCGGCHNAHGPLRELGLDLELRGDRVPAALTSTLGVASRYRPAGLERTTALRVTPGEPEASVLFLRMASRVPSEQMPPLGTRARDTAACDLVREWIERELDPRLERVPDVRHPAPRR